MENKKILPKFKGIYTKAEWVPMDSITPYEQNAKKHPPEQIQEIATAIQLFRWDQPIVVDGEGIIIKGHGRFAAAKLLELTEVPVIRRTDMSAAEVRASRIADNQTAESYWKIANLLGEMEELYGLDAELTWTGYSMDEIKALCPGLVETEEDFALDKSDWTTKSEPIGADGLIGKVIPKADRHKTPVDWLNSHDKVLVPFTGDREGLAALLWALENGVDRKKLIVVDSNFGLRQWRWHRDYLDYIEKQLKLTIHTGPDRRKEWENELTKIGYPTNARPWCCIRFRNESLRNVALNNSPGGDDVENWCTILGFPRSPDTGKPVYRFIGEKDDGTHYCAPFWNKDDSTLTAVIEESGLALNPLYQVSDRYLCPGCPGYTRPDYVFMKNHDEDLWIRWMVYFGKSWKCTEYFEREFNDQALALIGDKIEPREFGQYRQYALPLPDCPQPERVSVRFGDDYGWEEDDDPMDGRIDAPREKWYEPLGPSKGYIKMKEDFDLAMEMRKTMPIEDYMKWIVEEGKRIAAEEGLDKETVDEALED